MESDIKRPCAIENITVTVHKFQTLYFIILWPDIFFLCSSFLKILSGMANSIDPDQTAPSGAV